MRIQGVRSLVRRKFYKRTKTSCLRAILSCQSHKLFISRNAVFWQLFFPDHVRGFDPVERCLRRVEGLEAHKRFGDFIDEPMVLR